MRLSFPPYYWYELGMLKVPNQGTIYVLYRDVDRVAVERAAEAYESS